MVNLRLTLVTLWLTLELTFCTCDMSFTPGCLQGATSDADDDDEFVQHKELPPVSAIERTHATHQAVCAACSVLQYDRLHRVTC